MLGDCPPHDLHAQLEGVTVGKSAAQLSGLDKQFPAAIRVLASSNQEMKHRSALRSSARRLVCGALVLAPLATFADGGFGSHLFSKPLELLGPLIEIGGVALLLYLLFGALAFAFTAAHLVLLAFVVQAFFKRSFGGKGLRYSACLLVASYVALIALAYVLLRSQESDHKSTAQSAQGSHTQHQDVY